MPTIPNLPESRSAYPDSPQSTDINPERFGRDAAALSALGGEIADVGSKLMSVRKSAMEADAIANKSAETRDWYAQRSMELEKEDPINFSEKLRQEFEDRYNADMESMPTGDAQRGYSSRMDNYRASAYVNAMAVEAKNRSSHYRAGFNDRIGGAAERLRVNPSISYFTNEVKALNEDVAASTGSILGKDEASSYNRLGSHALAEGLLNGYYKSPKTADAGLAALEVIGDKITPDEHSVWRKKFEALKKTNRENTSQALRIKTRNVIASLTSDDNDVAQGVPQGDVVGLIAQLDNEPKLDGSGMNIAESQELQIQVMTADKIRSFANNMGKMSQAELAESKRVMAEDIKSSIKMKGFDDYTAAAYRDQIRSNIDTAWNRELQRRIKDPVLAVEQSFAGELPGSVDGFVPSQERITATNRIIREKYGIDSTAIMSKPNAAALTARLRTLGEESPEGLVDEVKRISANPYSKEIFSQLDDLPRHFKAISMMDSQEAMVSVARNFEPTRKQALEKAFAQQTSLTRNALDESVAKSTMKFRVGLGAMGKANIAVSETFREAVKLEAISNIEAGRTQSVDSAVAEAYKKVIGSNFHISGNAIIPTKIGTTPISKANIEAEMQRIYDPGEWEKMGIKIPTEYYGQGQDTFKDMLQRPGAGWVSNPEMTAAEYRIPKRDDPTDYFTLTDDRGVPVYISYYHQSKNPSDWAKRKLMPISERLNLGPTVKDTVDSFMSPPVQKGNLPTPDYEGYLEEAKRWWKQYWSGGSVQKMSYDALSTGSGYKPKVEVGNASETLVLPGKQKPEPEKQFSDRDEIRYRSPLPKFPIFGAMADEFIPDVADVSTPWDAPARIEKYLPWINTAEAKQELPGGLLGRVLHQESRFRQDIIEGKTKSSVGATGIAQFTAATGKAYGLTINDKVDDRKNPAKAIPAAARYLKDLFKKFGDWRMAVAAYNMGETRLRKRIKGYDGLDDAMKKNKSFPAETKNYVKSVFGE